MTHRNVLSKIVEDETFAHTESNQDNNEIQSPDQTSQSLKRELDNSYQSSATFFKGTDKKAESKEEIKERIDNLIIDIPSILHVKESLPEDVNIYKNSYLFIKTIVPKIFYVNINGKVSQVAIDHVNQQLLSSKLKNYTIDTVLPYEDFKEFLHTFEKWITSHVRPHVHKYMEPRPFFQGKPTIFYEGILKKGLTAFDIYFKKVMSISIFDAYEFYKKKLMEEKKDSILPFEQWLNHFMNKDDNLRIAEWSTLKNLYEKLNLVFLDEKERTKFEAKIENGLLYVKAIHPHRIFTDIEVDSEWRLADFRRPNKELMYVLAEDEKGKPTLYLGECDPGKFHHTSFTNKKILSAGTLNVHHGAVVQLTNKSGHYLPTEEEGQRMLLYLHTNHATECLTRGHDLILMPDDKSFEKANPKIDQLMLLAGENGSLKYKIISQRGITVKNQLTINILKNQFKDQYKEFTEALNSKKQVNLEAFLPGILDILSLCKENYTPGLCIFTNEVFTTSLSKSNDTVINQIKAEHHFLYYSKRTEIEKYIF